MSKTTSDRQTILKVLGTHGPADDYTIQKVARHSFGVYMTPSGARTRRSELVKDGFVQAVGTAKSPTGRAVTVWGV